MSNQGPTEPTDDQAALQADIERTREDLARTVDELTERLDVKARFQDKVTEVKHDAVEQARRPPVIAAAAGVLLAVVILVVLRRGKGHDTRTGRR
jgi:hypothetical protein